MLVLDKQVHPSPSSPSTSASQAGRCPVIHCKVIDHLHRERNYRGRELWSEAMEDLSKVVEELTKL